MKGFTIFVFVVVAISFSFADVSEWSEYASDNEGNFVVKITKDDDFLCMGSILYPQWVLTTAQCLENENITITAGSNWFTQSIRLRKTNLQTRLVTSKQYYVIHPNYTSQDSSSANIGLVYIEEPFNLGISSQVSRIWLPIEDYRPKSGKIFSWGERLYLLLGAQLHITHVSAVHDNDYCVARDMQPKKPYLMCSSGHSSPCYHDEGGPLVATTFKGTTVVGIINRHICQNPSREACNNVNAPTHYTSVPFFVRWIFDVVSFFVPPEH